MRAYVTSGRGSNLSLPLAHYFYSEIVLKGTNVFKVIRDRDKANIPDVPAKSSPTYNNMTTFGVYAQHRFTRTTNPSDAFIDTILRSYHPQTSAQVEHWARIFGSITEPGSEPSPITILQTLVRKFPKFEGDYTAARDIQKLLALHPEWMTFTPEEESEQPENEPSEDFDSEETSVTIPVSEEEEDTTEYSTTLVAAPFARPLELSDSEKDLLILRAGLNLSIQRIAKTLGIHFAWTSLQRIFQRVEILRRLPRVSEEAVKEGVMKVCARNNLPRTDFKCVFLLHLASHAAITEIFTFRRADLASWWNRESHRAGVDEDVITYLNLLLQNLSSLQLRSTSNSVVVHHDPIEVKDDSIVSPEFRGVPVLRSDDGKGYELKLNHWTVKFVGECRAIAN